TELGAATSERVEAGGLQLFGQSTMYQRFRVPPVGRGTQQRVADPPPRFRRRRVRGFRQRLLRARHERFELSTLGAHRLDRAPPSWLHFTAIADVHSIRTGG